jgi:hypothetical protein
MLPLIVREGIEAWRGEADEGEVASGSPVVRRLVFDAASHASRRGERWPEKSEQRRGKNRATGRI